MTGRIEDGRFFLSEKKPKKSDRLNVFYYYFCDTYQKTRVETRTMMKYYPHTVTSMCTMTLRG